MEYKLQLNSKIHEIKDDIFIEDAFKNKSNPISNTDSSSLILKSEELIHLKKTKYFLNEIDHKQKIIDELKEKKVKLQEQVLRQEHEFKHKETDNKNNQNSKYDKAIYNDMLKDIVIRQKKIVSLRYV